MKTPHRSFPSNVSPRIQDSKRRDYIPVQLWKASYKPPTFTFVERVPISKIKIDKKLFAWQNKVNPCQVDSIVDNFDVDFWMPILVTPHYYLLDGQHRIQAAKKLQLRFIDIVIVKETPGKYNPKSLTKV